ncbi:MAG: hypothetical protein JWR16_2475 [Nevskia sp.]|nr:hypothetical protein [Nevskia sp.]
MGWLDVGNFWHIAQNLLMWIPYYVILPLWLRRNSGIVSFPNVFCLDENPAGERRTLSRCVIEASFVSMLVLLLLDLFAWIVGPIA